LILADTSVWVDHLHKTDALMAARLAAGEILCHPFVVGELALGRIPERAKVLGELERLPRARIAFDEEVIDFIDRWSLVGRGVGYVDAHLLVAARLTHGATLWTRDKRVAAVAQTLGFASEDQPPLH
jgi:predicted nucleic acid-binding protein